LLVHIVTPKFVESHAWLCNPALLETVIMTPRLAATADWCRDIAIPALVLGWIAVAGFVGIDYSGPAPIVESLTADARFADKVQPIASGNPDVVTVAISATPAVTSEAVPVAHEVEPVITAVAPDLPATIQPDTPPQQTAASTDSLKVLQPETTASTDSTGSLKALQPDAPPLQMAALTDSSELLQPETAPQQAAKTATSEPGTARPAVDSIEVLDECFAVDACVDRYLWALYRRTPKEDAVRNHEQRNVSVKRKGKLVTVTRTITTVVDENFAWKDPKAAEHVSMPIMDYVIGGVDRDFKFRLFHMLQAAEEAGLSPGITSAFRDDYRQSIATGLKAANDRSYHGGSFHGGYGHGLAADVVSVNGATRSQRQASSETLWKWIDTHGMEFGIGRPYLDRDPPHVAPIDGKEYADHHRGAKARQAGSAAKSRNRFASADHRRAPKHT
jgi:D-alanyl-D-alanine carboxypeptidase